MASRSLSRTDDRRPASSGSARGSPRLLSMVAAHLAAHWQIMPAVLFMSIAFVYPVGLLLSASFTDATGALAMEHYVRLYDSAVVSRVLVITFKIAAWTTLFSVVAAYPVAYLLATAGKNTRNLLIILVLMPFWTSFLVRTFAWIVLLGRNGVVSELAALLGLESPSLLYNFTGVMIGMVHALMPLCVLTMLSVMEGIDTTLVRAASTLGARPAQAFLRVYLPLSLPGIAAGALLVFITALGFFITPALLGSERETVIVQLIIFQIKEMLNWGFAGSIAVLLLVVALIVFYVYDRLVGLSTLSGGAARLDESPRQNPIGWFGRRAGRLAIELAGASLDAVSRLIERIWPPRPDRPRRSVGYGLVWITALLIIAFLAVPAFFIIPVSFTEGRFLSWPPQGFSLQWYESVLANPAWTEAAIRSLLVAMVAGGLGLLLGVPAAFYIVRRARYKTALIGFLVAPIIMPNIIIAVALFYLFASIGLVGSMAGLAIGHTILAVPYVVVTIVAVLKNYDFRLDQAAYTLGANRLRTFRYVTLPIIKSGLVAAFMFAFVISFDELTIALFIAGGGNATLPRKMWDDALLQVSPSLAAVAAMVLVFMTAIILLSEYARRRGAQGT
jgi:putative spermidine/putrescine transport system permease protein